MTISQSDADASLARVKEGVQFLLKLDFALLAAALAIGSLFKLDGRELLVSLTSHKLELKFLGALIVYALVMEFHITWLRNGLSRWIEEKYFSRVVAVINLGYALQVLAHTLIVVGVIGYVSGVLDCMSLPACSGT